VPGDDRKGATWFRLDGQLDGQGWLVGHQLHVGTLGAPPRRIDVGAESFATGPFAGMVILGEDDGVESRLRAVDAARGCATVLGSTTDVIRSAIAEPQGDAVFEHRVNRLTRSDEGIWRRPLHGGVPARILAPLPADPAYGRTFATELAFGPDGRLAVVSCGEQRCRVRILDPASGASRQIAPTGPLVGVGAADIVVHGVCPGFPCSLEAIDLEDGSRRSIAEAAGLAVLVGHAAGLVVHEAERGMLRAVDLGSDSVTWLGRLSEHVRLVPASTRHGAGVSLPEGFVLLARDGRLGAGDVTMLDPRTGSRVVVKGFGR
jgi:hypothetical protein